MKDKPEAIQAVGEVLPNIPESGDTCGLNPAIPLSLNREAAERFRHRLDYSYGLAGDFGKAVLEAVTGEEPIGYGVEKLVYKYREGQVIALLAPYSPEHAEKDYSPEAIKRTFYQRKLLHILAPECMPDIRMAGTSPPILVMDEVDRPHSRDEMMAALEEKRKKTKDDPQSHLSPLGLGIDPTGGNFVLDKNGNTFYVDNPLGTMDKPAVVAAIDGLPEEEKRKALKYLKRLEELGAEFETQEPGSDTEISEEHADPIDLELAA